MHTLTQKRVNRFAREFGFDDDIPTVFEKYVAATYLYRYVQNSVEAIEKCVIGGGNDEGVDVAAVIVNNQIVFEPNEIDELISDQNSSTARVVFIQAKTSESYDSKLMSKFLHGVESISKYALDSNSVKLPSQLADIALLIERIAENMASFSHTRIPCDLYYITTSSNDGKLAADELQVSQAVERIRELELFEKEIRLQSHGHEEILAKEKERKGPQNVSFQFKNYEVLPSASDVSVAYIGYLPINQVLNLLQENDEIRPGIFDDNVRLDLGAKNPVNQSIFETLVSDDRGYFPLLNNGLTVIASKLENVGNSFYISGYQIVNGGQTSHQLLRWANSVQVVANPELLEQVAVSIKIVSSQDKEVRSRVAIATNRQTAIGNTDIQASAQIAKDVEEFFNESGPDGLRYERQSRGVPLEFPRARVVQTSDLNRAVAASIFGQSSKAISSPKDLESEDSFVWGEYPVEMYYYSAFIIYRIDRFLTKPERSCLKAAKYHIAMMVSAIVAPNVVEVYKSGTINHKKLSTTVVCKINNKTFPKAVESAIQIASDLASQKFESVLSEGRSLRKDDVRAQSHQEDLLSEAMSTL